MKINEVLQDYDKFKDIYVNSNFFKQYGTDVVLLRGEDRRGYVDNEINNFKLRKAPRDTFMPFHNTVNELSVKKVGIPVRSCLFTTTSHMVAGDYGDGFIICPLGNYKIFSNPNVRDMTIHYDVRHLTVADKLQYILGDVKLIRHNKEDTLDTYFKKLVSSVGDSTSDSVYKLRDFHATLSGYSNEYVDGLGDYTNKLDASFTSEIMTYCPDNFLSIRMVVDNQLYKDVMSGNLASQSSLF